MFAWCFGRQTSDEDVYRQRPKTRSSLIASSDDATPTAAAIITGSQESNEPTTNMEQMQNECLEMHNKLRAKHGVGPLTLNKEMCADAAKWAKHLASNNKLQRRKGNVYGENLYLGTGMGSQAHELAVQSWYDEIKHYNFNRPGFSPTNGHFTQVIWKTSKELGVGIEIRDNRIWVVCFYNPAGNVMGNYEHCVPPLIEDTVTKVIDKMKSKAAGKKKTSIHADDAIPSTSNKDVKQWTEFQLECRDSHNNYRSLHGCPPMILNKKLSDLALDWAQQLAKQGVMKHRPNNEYGENIYYALNFDPTAEQCVKSWYDEIKYYNFSKPGFSSQTGHFTQVVWRDSLELGVGVCKLNNTTFVVCNYSPPGNVLNYFKEQVPRPGSKPTTRSSLKYNTSAEKQQSFEELCLDSHNNLRAIHGSPPLTLNKNLNFFAKDWAQFLATNNQLETRKNNRFGENIYCATNRAVNGHDPVQYWYSGIQDYNFNNPGYSPAVANFTQLVWKSSKQLGVGVATALHSTYVVCNYDPKGNILNEFAENVPPVGGLLADKHRNPQLVDQFTADMLNIHNFYRANHGCPPLKLSQELIDYCLVWANKILNREPLSDAPEYIITSIEFEGAVPSPEKIVSNWYDEIENYDYNDPGYSIETENFTQIIWKRTEYMGVGVSKRDQKTVVCLSYEPPGNMEKLYAENVPPEL